ncbi:hypothetical protein GCM10009642_31230 [Nocardiopsis metallicus]
MGDFFFAGWGWGWDPGCGGCVMVTFSFSTGLSRAGAGTGVASGARPNGPLGSGRPVFQGGTLLILTPPEKDRIRHFQETFGSPEGDLGFLADATIMKRVAGLSKA